MPRLLLVRHGQASYGQADYDRLSPRGEEQARALGAHLSLAPPDAIFVGPHVRQRDTYARAAEAAHAAGTPLPSPILLDELAEYPAFAMLAHFLPRLAEVDPKFARLADAPTPRLYDEAFQVVLARWGDDSWQAPELERVDAFVGRVRAALDRAIRAAASGARVALVTSAGPIGVALGLATALAPPRMLRASVVVKNASITELQFRSAGFAWLPDQLSLVTFNTTGHLPPALVTER